MPMRSEVEIKTRLGLALKSWEQRALWCDERKEAQVAQEIYTLRWVLGDFT